MEYMTIEKTILKNLMQNEEYVRRVLPFLHVSYFQNGSEKTLFKSISQFIEKYNTVPTKEALVISLSDEKALSESEFENTCEVLDEIEKNSEETEFNWLIDNTEKFCKDKAVYNAIMESIHIIDGKSQTKTENAIPNILSDALSVSFDPNVGHDYIEDSDERYEFYHKVESKLGFDLSYFNEITKGGTPQKTLNVILAGTGVGKSLFMCHHAANCLTQGKNVLYITCEMAEERIAERIDANLMDITLDDLGELPKQTYSDMVEKHLKNLTGKLIIKEYPTASANVNHFKALLEELRLKKNFKPDIIFVDYLNICASARMKMGTTVNSYTYIKSIAEELRGLAVEYNIPVFTATQTNRQGYANSDVDLTDTSESFGLPATADFMFAIISTDELDELNQVMVKQLKNRYNDTIINKKFVIGINRAKMKLYDVEDSAQIGLIGSGQSSAANGYDGNNFDEKFFTNKPKIKTEFSEWKV